MTSLVGVNEALRPSLMIILGVSWENTEWAGGDGVWFNWQEHAEASGRREENPRKPGVSLYPAAK